MEIVDATGEGWAFHPDLMVVSPLTLKKRWKKIDVIQLFNKSDNSLRIGTFYPEAYIPRRSLPRIIAEVAALTAKGQPRKPQHGDAASRPGSVRRLSPR